MQPAIGYFAGFLGSGWYYLVSPRLVLPGAFLGSATGAQLIRITAFASDTPVNRSFRSERCAKKDQSQTMLPVQKCLLRLPRVVMVLSTLLFLSSILFPAFARDLNVLIRVVYAAYFVEQGAAMCSVPGVLLSNDDRVLFVNTKNYAQWIKQKVSADLSPEEVSFILKSAADRARGELGEVVKILKSYPPDREYAELSAWCTTKMTSFASKVVVGYVNDREKIDGIIDNAKRN